MSGLAISLAILRHELGTAGARGLLGRVRDRLKGHARASAVRPDQSVPETAA